MAQQIIKNLHKRPMINLDYQQKQSYHPITRIVCTLLALALLEASTSSFQSITQVSAFENKIGPSDQHNRLLLLTVATDPSNEGFKRFNNSVNAFDLNLSVLGANQEWLGGNVKIGRGGGQKLNLFHRALTSYKNENDLIVLFVDSYDLVVNGDSRQIINRFKNNFDGAQIVFSAEANCWPDKSLESKYPVPLLGGNKFLNSGSFIGFAPALWALFDAIGFSGGKQIKDTDDDQLLLTNAYLNSELRSNLSINLDHRAQLFQNLLMAEGDIKLEFENNITRLLNTAYGTEPIIIHGNGPSKLTLNSLGNYLGKAWTIGDGCRLCNSTRRSLERPLKSSVLLALFIVEATPFLNDFFASVTKLSYPKELIHLRIYNSINYHSQEVELFVANITSSGYASLKQLTKDNLKQYYAKLKHEASNNNANDANTDNYYVRFMQNETMPEDDKYLDFLEWLARSLTVEECQAVNCRYYLSLDSIARLEFEATIEELIETHRPILAPLLSRPNQLWSNFWGAIDEDGYYLRSADYVELVERKRLGVWNVPQVMNAYVIDATYFTNFLSTQKHLPIAGCDDDESTTWVQSADSRTHYDIRSCVTKNRRHALINPRLCFIDPHEPLLKPMIAFSRYIRSLERVNEVCIGQFMSNIHEFGHLVDANHFNTSLAHPNFYQLEHNLVDWQRNYLHENYSQVLADNHTIEQPCPDVYWFPLVNDRFCYELVQIMETFGKWSGGTNDDPRIEGGYESVPTRDIHMKQVGLHDAWLAFLKEHIMPIQLKQYIGYEHDPPQAELAFVVRYNPAEQASLRPHHDASTYTVNIALNSPHADYDGGGCRFVRYNCSVVDSRKGWALIHPGRLTHYHEGLSVTRGTRYIMVTFVDP